MPDPAPLADAVFARLEEVTAPDRVERTPATLEAYARDACPLGHLAFAAGADPPWRRPQAVVWPTSVAEVQEIVRVCRAAGVPLVPWGAGSGVCGGTLAVRGGVALDLKRLDRLVEIEPCAQLVTVEPGLNLQLLEDALGRAGFTLGHFPSSITCSTIGGALAARGAGQLSTRYGKVEDMVVGLSVVLPDGTLVRTPVVPRAATGPDWNQVFVGSEGTLGIIVGATLRLWRRPEVRLFRSYAFGSLSAGLAAVREGLQRGARPAAVRLYDPLDTLLVARAGDASPAPLPSAELPPDPPLGRSWPHSVSTWGGLRELLSGLLPELGRRGKAALLRRPEQLNALVDRLPGTSLLILTFEGEERLAAAEEEVFAEVCARLGAEDRGPEPAERWWRNRIAVSFKQSEVYALGAFVDTMEVATTWDRLEALHDAVRGALARHALVMAHFSHAYPEGCSMYFTFAAARGEPAEALERYRAAWRDAQAAVVSCGGAVSHHHGVGLLKAEGLRRSHGALHGVLSALKRTLDPENILNPGKLGLP